MPLVTPSFRGDSERQRGPPRPRRVSAIEVTAAWSWNGPRRCRPRWGMRQGPPDPPFHLLHPAPGNTSPALSGKPLTSRAPVWEDDSLRRKANPCPSGLNPPSGNACFPGQASRRSEILVLPGRSQGLSDCPTPTSPVTAGKLRPRRGGVPSATGSPPQTYRPL